MMKKDISRNVLSLSSKVDKERTYWLEKLSGELSKNNFPYDFYKTDVTTEQQVTGKIEYQFSQDLVIKLNRMTNQSDQNLYMILLAGLTLILYKYTGNTDILIGAPIYNQPIEGEFLNTMLAIRNRFSAINTFKELIMQTRNNLTEANVHLNYPIERLLYHLDIPSSPYNHGFSLFETVVLLENIQNRKYLREITPRILFSFVKRDNHTIEGTVEYNTGLYKKETLQRILDYLLKILWEIDKIINCSLGDVDILSEEERQQLLQDFNSTNADFPADKTICQWFEEQAERTSIHIAVVCPMENRSITYHQLNEKSLRLAQLLHRKGAKNDTITAIISDPSIGMIISILAIWKTGGAYLPIHPDSPTERIGYMLRDSNAHLLVANGIEPPVLAGWEGDIIQLTGGEPEIELQPDTLPTLLPTLASVPALSPAYVLYTSGTTGKPKGVVLTHRNMANYISWLSKTLALTPHDKTVLTASYAFDLGYTSIYGALLNGGQLHLLSREDYVFGENLIDYIKENGITFLKITPSLFSLLVNHPNFSVETCASLRVVLLGGEPIVTADVALAKKRCGHIRVINHYGPTEATVGCIAQQIDFDRFDEYQDNPTIGQPIANTRVFILDTQSNLLPVGIPGELCIAGKGLAMGYLNQPELTAEKFVQSPTQITPSNQPFLLYRTGDLARWMPHGKIEFLGRIDHQIKIRGLRIELGEIENQLLKHDDIEDAVVTVREDETREKYLCAYYVSTKNAIMSELREYMVRYLPEYMIPSFFIQLERIPLTPNGKVDRRALPLPETKTTAQYQAPRNNLEAQMATMWANILGKEKETIGIDSSFFDLGGNSLKVTIMVARVHKELNVRLPIAEIFRNPVIRELSKYIETAIKEKFYAIEPVEKKEYYPLSSAQNRLYFIYLMYPLSIAYNSPNTLVMEGDIDKNRLENAFKKLIQRHESLRTAYYMVGEEPVQRVYDTVEFTVEYHQEVDVKEIVHQFVRPFDLSKAPLFRAALIKENENRHIFMVDRHHIITDGISKGILEKDFMSFYAGEELTPLKLHYKDFSVWQKQLLQSGALQKQEEHWLNQFKGDIPVLNLPSDFPKSTGKRSDEGGFVPFYLDKPLTTAVKETLKDTGATLFMLTLAVYNILLARYSGTNDIVVGSPVIGRRHSDLEKIIGIFINMLSLRNQPKGDKSFLQFLEEVKENALNAYENQDYQFEELVSKLGLQGVTDKHPLFNVICADLLLEEPEITNPQLTLKTYGQETTTVKFDLRLIITDSNNTIQLGIEYAASLFKRSTIEKMTHRFIEILRQVVDNKHIKLEDITLSHDLTDTTSHSLQDYQEEFEF